MPAEQIQAYENAGNIFKDKLDKKKTENTDRDFRRVMGEKKKKKKCGKKEESWFDKRQKIIRARLKAQANLNAERRGEMSRIEQENHAKIQAAGANRLHNFLVEDTGRENGKTYSAKCNSQRKTGIPHISGRGLFPGGACLVYLDE